MDGQIPWRGVVTLIVLLWLFGAAAPARAQNAQDTDVAAARYQDDAQALEEGRTAFNVHCAHCHGPNAVQGERVRDLRRLFRRYGNDMTGVFFKTAMGGREEKGMPSWAGSIEPDVLWKIYAFLQTVQKR